MGLRPTGGKAPVGKGRKLSPLPRASHLPEPEALGGPGWRDTCPEVSVPLLFSLSPAPGESWLSLEAQDTPPPPSSTSASGKGGAATTLSMLSTPCGPRPVGGGLPPASPEATLPGEG